MRAYPMITRTLVENFRGSLKVLICKKIIALLSLCNTNLSIFSREAICVTCCKIGWAPQLHATATWNPELVFLNVYGAQTSIPWNEFRQPM
jgi:hypothetical protein